MRKFICMTVFRFFQTPLFIKKNKKRETKEKQKKKKNVTKLQAL